MDDTARRMQDKRRSGQRPHHSHFHRRGGRPETGLLFYRGIEREFSRASYSRGQQYYRQNRVQNVRRSGQLVSGKVKGSAEDSYYTALVVDNGKIMNSKCTCPAHRQYESHCKHVAALTIWVCERSRRMGWRIENSANAELPEREMILTDPKNAAFDIRLKKLVAAHPEVSEGSFVLRKDRLAAQILGKRANGLSYAIPVTMLEAHALAAYTVDEAIVTTVLKEIPSTPIVYLRGQVQGRVFLGVSIEPALSFTDPQTRNGRAELVSTLQYDWNTQSFKTEDGLQLKPANASLPVIESLNAPPVQYQGQAALDLLGDILSAPPDAPGRKNLVIQPTILLEVHPQKLKLASVKVGKKTDKGRELAYRYEGGGVSFASEELVGLAAFGKVSSRFVWKENRIYEFETPLTMFSRMVSKSGTQEDTTKEGEDPAFQMDRMASLYEDSAHPLHPLAIYRLSLELGATDFVVDEEWKEFHEWKSQFENPKGRKIPEVEFGFILRNYQENGLQWLWSLYDRGLSALLADDMGLGKTHQVLALLSSFYRAKKDKPKLPTLVVAPTSVVTAWAQKLTKYETGLKWHVYHGKGRVLPDAKVNLVLTSYGLLTREAALLEKDWHAVVLDEAQYIKNPTTLTARAARALKADYRIAMTGTPVENNAADFWSLFEFLIPGYLGALPRFKNLYTSARGIPSEEQAKVLRRLTGPFLLRRTKDQVLKELPEKTEEIRECRMTDTQKKVYKAALRSADASKVIKSLKGDGPIDYANMLALLTRLKQICDHPDLPGLSSSKKGIKGIEPEHSGKWDAFLEIVHEAADSNLKVVVFTQYLGMLDMMSATLDKEGIGHSEIRGDTQDRGERLKKFAEDPSCKVFLCSLLAGGLGIDLTAASVCIHMDRWWNPAKENQATDRLHRIGQTRGVQVFKLQIPGTVEDRIAAIIESKLDLASSLIEESSAGLKSFSRQELLALFDTKALDEAPAEADEPVATAPTAASE
jgi:superfamily II DNA or RNA helicase